MPPRAVWAIFRKTYLASGMVLKFISRYFSSNPLLDCGPCLALGCPYYFRYSLLAPLQGIRFSSHHLKTSLCSRLPGLSHSYIQARWTAERRLADVCSTSFRQSAQAACIDIFLAVFSCGFGQHPVVRFHFGQCNGALGRSTPSWCHKETFFSHCRVRWNVYYYDRGTPSSDPIVRL